MAAIVLQNKSRTFATINKHDLDLKSSTKSCYKSRGCKFDMDLKIEILKYSQKSTCKNMQERKGFFMFPYYNYIYDAITKIIDKYPFVQMDGVVGLLSYQVVSYAYNNYLKFVYPFEFNLAKENNFLKGYTEEEQGLFFRDKLSSNDEWITYFFEKYPKLLSILELFCQYHTSY